jgi:cobalt/nickel transport protein
VPAPAHRISESASGSTSGSAACARRPPRSGAPRILARVFAALTLMQATAVLAHLLELIPNTEIVDTASGRDLRLELRFTHPMARGPGMPMAEPVRFGVLAPGGEKDLRDRLRPSEIDGSRVYRADVRIDAPGDHIFFVEPAPYWEPAEARLMVHCWWGFAALLEALEPTRGPDGEPVPVEQGALIWVRAHDMRPAD